VAGKAEKITAKAVGRVLGRHAMSTVAGYPLSFEQFACEVTAELARVLQKRAAKGARVSDAAIALAAALTSVGATAPAAAEGWAVLDPAQVRLMVAARDRVAAGGPRPGFDPECN